MSLLPDGTVLVASQGDPFPTELRVERYTPPYLSGGRAAYRPANVTVVGGAAVLKPGAAAGSGGTIQLRFNLARPARDVKVVLCNNGFVTHSVRMGQRMVYCEHTGLADGALAQSITVQAPPSNSIVPPGYYLMFVVADGVPSHGQQLLVS